MKSMRLLAVLLALLVPAWSASAETLVVLNKSEHTASLIDPGSGKTLATIAGTAGGAYAGKKVADNTTRTRWKVSVKFDDGHYETCDQGSAKNLHVGDRVQVRKGKAYRL